MKSYSQNDIIKSLKKVGLKKGDLVHINPEIFKLGQLSASKNLNVYSVFFSLIKKLIGDSGTICLNTFTFNTLRNGDRFTYEDAKSTSGGFSKFLLKKKKIVRSHHPVYSISAIGPKAKIICKKNSSHNFGYNSPYDKFVKLNGKILNIGMDPWKNQYNHVAEHMIGVPYYYNKLTEVKYFQEGKKKNHKFSTAVRYLNFKLDWEFKYIKKELSKKKIIKKAKLGDGFIYSMNAKEYLNICLQLLTKDQFALIKRKYYFNKIK